MQTGRIGPISRAGSEHTLEGSAQIIPRMHLQEIAPCLVQPGQQDEPITCGEPEYRFRKARIELDPGRRRAFGALLGSGLRAPKR